MSNEEKVKPQATGLPVGVNRGFIVTRRAVSNRTFRRKGQANPRTRMIREVIRETSGHTVYERRIMELIKVGTSATLKRALKLAKRRLGTHRRGKEKRDAMQEVILEQRRRQAAAATHHA